ncbi:hypothetical protein OBBRIDRAFT_327434 [Obba rivulosa]|uniref:C2H2-type domain-containing protein n=1 Tax=Obba rivulosa TaxID=1052685 RepID=A0A8E2DPF3_9APHY|nr:hypothetical protein OBBRIDRAFT_327434 [Obba rivulosa]
MLHSGLPLSARDSYTKAIRIIIKFCHLELVQSDYHSAQMRASAQQHVTYIPDINRPNIRTTGTPDPVVYSEAGNIPRSWFNSARGTLSHPDTAYRPQQTEPNSKLFNDVSLGPSTSGVQEHVPEFGVDMAYANALICRCPECSADLQPGSLQRHIDSVHRRRAFPCTRCGKLLSRRDALKRHWSSRSCRRGQPSHRRSDSAAQPGNYGSESYTDQRFFWDAGSQRSDSGSYL